MVRHTHLQGDIVDIVALFYVLFMSCLNQALEGAVDGRFRYRRTYNLVKRRERSLTTAAHGETRASFFH